MKSFAQVKGFAFWGNAGSGRQKAEGRMAGWGWLDMKVLRTEPQRTHKV
jgi:hypothetical protein